MCCDCFCDVIGPFNDNCAIHITDGTCTQIVP
jgi:hypothetical protein